MIMDPMIRAYLNIYYPLHIQIKVITPMILQLLVFLNFKALKIRVKIILKQYKLVLEKDLRNFGSYKKINVLFV